MTVGAATYRVEVAQSVEAQRQGLAGRDELPAGTGMLFELDGHRQQVWGAGMYLPIDVVWIDDGQVIGVDQLDPCTAKDQATCQRIDSPGLVDAVLEVPSDSNIATGDRVTISPHMG